MRTRTLGKTDLQLTTVGLGTWAIGGPWQYGWGPQNDNDSITAIHEALDEGINWIDSAPIYGCGHSEQVVGRALKQTSSKPLIATKYGLLWNDKREKVNCLDKQSIVTECESSLKRLGIEVIDLYQMHWASPDEQIEEAWSAMQQLARAGKIRYAGVSNCTSSQMDRLTAIYPIASQQPPYNMLNRSIEDQLLGYCKENDIGIVAYSPMEKGLLTGKFNAEKVAQLPPDDVRLKDPQYAEPLLSANIKLIESLTEIAARNDKTVAQLAIAWVLRRPEITAAIVGARKPGQIKETAKAANWILTDEEIEEIEDLLKSKNEIIF